VEIEITYSPPLRPARLIKRYKRFLADVATEEGETFTVLCPNTGSMKTCCEPGRPVRLSRHDVPGRTYPYTLEMIEMGRGWVGVNTGIPNNLVARAAQYGGIPEFISYPTVRREVRYGVNSRVDLLLEGPPGRAWVEVKNVSMLDADAVSFPDAVTERGRTHLEELTRVRRAGDRATMLFVAQRPEGSVFRPADAIDPEYGRALRRAAQAGVEILAYRAVVSPAKITWGPRIPVDLPPL
jgi:sugar fermentation stimulation protein A